MKRILLALLLICSLLLSVAACAANPDANPAEDDSTGSTTNQTQGDGEETDLPTDDNPEENIAYIVEMVNAGVDLSSLVDEILDEVKKADLSATVHSIVEGIANAEYEASATITFNGETGNVYAGMKDRVLYAEMESGEEKEYAYIFIEDDYTLVSVTEEDSAGYPYYNANVESSIAEGMTSLDSIIEQVVATLDSDEADEIIELAKKLLVITLPEMTEDDITYEDGRYYISNDYAAKAIKQVIHDSVEKLAEEYPDEFDVDEIDEYVDQTIEMVLENVDIELWLHAESKTITGFGVDVASKDEELGTKAFLDINKTRVEVTVDVNDGALSVVADIKLDSEGMFESAAVTAELDLPFTDYIYAYDQEQGRSIEYKAIGRQLVFAEATLVLPTENTNGDVLNLEIQYKVADCTVYIGETEEIYDPEYDYTYYETVFNTVDEERTAAYSCGEANVTAKVTMNGFEKIVVDFDLSTTGFENSSDVNMAIDATVTFGSADNMPTLPQAVIDAKDQALASYGK